MLSPKLKVSTPSRRRFPALPTNHLVSRLNPADGSRINLPPARVAAAPAQIDSAVGTPNPRDRPHITCRSSTMRSSFRAVITDR
jgi:hypothetical protein